MAARFSGAVETGRRWGGSPEQARVWIDNTLSRTLLLGFDKANQVSTGMATTGRLRPGRFLASVKPFFYNLADSSQLRALRFTWHHLAAYAAGFKQRPHHPAYRLVMGQDRELCRTEYQPGQYEILVASCYNQNYHESDDPQLFAWHPEVRRVAWERYYQLYPVVPGYCFQIYRVSQDGTRIHEAQRGDSYEVPFAAVELLVQQAERVLRELWLYLQRNQSQVQIRHDAFPQDEWIARWQLYDPPPFNEFVGPDLNYTFAFSPDPQLFGVDPEPLAIKTSSIARETRCLTPVHPLEEPEILGQPSAAACTPEVQLSRDHAEPVSTVCWLIWMLEKFLRWLLAWGAVALQSRPSVLLISLPIPVNRPVDSYDPPQQLARGPPSCGSST